MNKYMHIKDLYGFPGFRAQCRLKEHSFDPGARIVTLNRRQKKRFVPGVATLHAVFATGKRILCGTWTQRKPAYTLNSSIGAFNAQGATP
jgi:hypothetical protein